MNTLMNIATGNQIKLEAVYEDPDINLQQHTPKIRTGGVSGLCWEEK